MTAEDRFGELVSLAALGALDGDARANFEAHRRACAACSGELAAQRALASRIPLALGPAVPPPGVRRRVLDATRPAPARTR